MLYRLQCAQIHEIIWFYWFNTVFLLCLPFHKCREHNFCLLLETDDFFKNTTQPRKTETFIKTVQTHCWHFVAKYIEREKKMVSEPIKNALKLFLCVTNLASKCLFKWNPANSDEMQGNDGKACEFNEKKLLLVWMECWLLWRSLFREFPWIDRAKEA